MSIQLFSHNQIAYNSALEMLESCGKAAIIHPTGTGKSFIGFKLCEEKNEEKICWLSPSEYIFRTQIENLKKAGGTEPNNICFYTYAKLMLMSEEELSAINPNYIVLDEFHRCGAEMWGEGVQRLLRIFSSSKILGLSATAIRYLDNQRDMAAELFDGNVASEMTLGEAIVRGILNPPTYILSVYSYQKDLEKYQKRIKGAKNRAVRDEAEKYYEALRRALEKADGLDLIFKKHIKTKDGKYIVFCANVEHMKDMIEKVPEWFGAVDNAPHIYSAYSDDPATSKAFAEFKADESEHLKLLFCIDMLNEGVHVEKIDGVILFRPTVSPIIYKQQIGRALSASKDKEPIIFDIVNNIDNLYSIGTIEQEMQIAMNYYRFLGIDEEIVNEHFKIVDEVQNVRQIFDKLNDTLTASWDMMYGFAKQYYTEYGNLEVPRRYKTEGGYSLGHWIFTQRKVYKGEAYGTLGKDRIKKLEAIGMVWDSIRDISWQRYYDLAKVYYDEHGDLNVPCDYKKANGIDLAAWIRRIRSYRKSGIQKGYLTEERIAELDKMGMIWNIPDYLWEENFAGALDFYRQNGHLNIPAEYCAPNGLKIGTWIRRQRALRAGKAKTGVPPTEEQIARLDEIGMNWKNHSESAWDRGYKATLAYYQEHGNIDVPTTYVTPTGYRLGAWLADRRENGKENHSEEQQKQLDELGMVWIKPDSWEVRYALAKKYYEEHGDLNIPPKYKADGIWLSKWVNEQRQIYIGNRGKKKLTEEQIKRLEAIGMVWENRNHLVWSESWYNQFKGAQVFYQQYGHLNIPSEYDNGNGKQLATWVVRQRALKAKGKLPKEQIELLESIGMVWVIDDPWEIGFAHAKEYYTANGDLLVNPNYVCPDGYNLGGWITNQRANCKTADKYRKLDKVQNKRLNEIGMVWNVGEFRWEEAYKRAATFYRENGHLVIPRYYGQEKEFDLYEWVMSQRNKYRSGELSEDKIRKLEKIGMDWLTSVERDWENHYDSAERYYRKHGTLTMPCTYVDESGFPLGMWLWRIRTNKTKLRTEGANGNQIERLRAIGFEFSTETEEIITPKAVCVV